MINKITAALSALVLSIVFVLVKGVHREAANAQAFGQQLSHHRENIHTGLARDDVE